MIEIIEKIQRSLLYFTLIFISTLPSYLYIHSLESKLSYITIPIISISGALALIYVSLCLCYNGKIKLKNVDNICKDGMEQFKTCFLCDAPKPERSHHCSTCGGCIKKMDHHCHWIGRCINYDNHGHFIRFLFFSNILAGTILFANSYYLYKVLNLIINFEEITKINIFVLILSYIFSSVIFVITTIHLRRQSVFVAKNITFIEYYQCDNFDTSINSSPYNLGIIHNIRDILGPFRYLLLWKPTGNGISFKKRYPVMYWPKNKGFSDKYYYETV